MRTAYLFLTIAATGASREDDDVARLRGLAAQSVNADLRDVGHRSIVVMLAALALVKAEPKKGVRDGLARRLVEDFPPDKPVPSTEDALQRLAAFSDADPHYAIELLGHSRTLLHAVMSQEYAGS